MENIGYDWKNFDYPINFYLENKRDESWDYKPVLGEKKSKYSREEMLDYKLFNKVYYFHPGENEEESWIFVVHHKNGYFIYFEAKCDYTGFDCRGDGRIIYSKNSQSLYNLGLTKYVRSVLTSPLV